MTHIFTRDVGPYRVGDHVGQIGDEVEPGPWRYHQVDPQRFAALIANGSIQLPRPKSSKRPEPLVVTEEGADNG